uniref:Uncharacterized protein n=1 Tax=Anguilla anguilla TaxID=7936 RepID=A0A0E9UJC0_ANGAN
MLKFIHMFNNVSCSLFPLAALMPVLHVFLKMSLSFPGCLRYCTLFFEVLLCHTQHLPK